MFIFIKDRQKGTSGGRQHRGLDKESRITAMARHPWREKKPSEWFGKKEQLEDGSWFAQCLYCDTNPDNEVDGGCIYPPKKEYFPQYYEKHLKKHDAAAAKRQKTAASRSADHGSDSEDSTAEYDLMNEPIESWDTKRLIECLDRFFRGESTFAPELNRVGQEPG